MASSQTPQTAFFGATGGCALGALTRSLQAGIYCSALARTPAKLSDALLAAKVPQTAIDTYLSIVPGDVRDVTAVKKTLTSAGRGPGDVADVIVSGVGAYPKMQLSIVRPLVSMDQTITEDTVTTIFTALKELQSSRKPLLLLMSTTGLSKTRDLPYLMIPLYRWALASPHEDKLNMENLAVREAAKGSSSVISGVVVTRASALMDGKGQGLEKLRVGWEYADGLQGAETAPGPAIGYTIVRDDVGAWVFQEIIQNGQRSMWANKLVTLTA